MLIPDYNTIVDFLSALASMDPDIKAESIGQSTESREISVLKLEKAGKGRPNIVLEGGRYFQILHVLDRSETLITYHHSKVSMPVSG